MEKAKRKQLICEVGEALHSQIKVSAALRGISMSSWIIRALKNRLKNEKQYLEAEGNSEGL